MKKQLDELINGGWKEKDEFTKFKEALENIPKESKHDAKREYFGRMVKKFFDLYGEESEEASFRSLEEQQTDLLHLGKRASVGQGVCQCSMSL